MKGLQIVGLILLIVLLVGVLVFGILVSLYGQARAKNQWANVTYWKDDDHYKARVEFADDLSNVSAIHIHREMGGTVGPIIAWLATTSGGQNTWNGNSHHGSMTNAPCCTSAAGQGCTLLAPLDTPMVADMAGKTLELKIPYKNLPGSCEADDHLKKRNVYLVVHGTNFTAANKYIDILNHTKFK